MPASTRKAITSYYICRLMMDYLRLFKHPWGIFLLLNLFFYVVIEVSPAIFWPVAFINLLYPPFLVLNILLTIYFLVKKEWKKVVVLGVLWLFTGHYFNRMVTWHFASKEADIQIISYNVRVFNAYAHLADEGYQSSKKMLQFLKESPADVLCLQEYYNDVNDPVFATQRQLKKAYPYMHKSKMTINHNGAEFGMVIFSKWPVVHKGAVELPTKGGNQIIYIDVKKDKDTLRIYNMHLQSMSINEQALKNNSSGSERFQTAFKTALKQFKKGAVQRSWQVDVLTQHIEECPYPVIVCGDLNDPPFSYTYEKLSDVLDNSFESGGKGMGISYNGSIPFLRIDQQFYSESLKIQYFNTLNSIRYSDHYPIMAGYSFDK